MPNREANLLAIINVQNLKLEQTLGLDTLLFLAIKTYS